MASPIHPNKTEPTYGRRGAQMMILAGAILGTLGLFLIEADVHPLTAVFFRCAFGALALLIYAVLRGRQADIAHSGPGWRLAISSASLMVANWALFFFAIQATNITVATVVFHIQPLWVILAGAWLFGERLSRRHLAAATAALAGLALATGFFDTSALLTGNYMLGLLAALVAAACYAGVTLLAKSNYRSSGLALAFWQCALGAMLLSFWPLHNGLPTDSATWAWLIGLGVVHTGFVYALTFEGMRRLDASRIGVLQFVYPAAAIALDVLVYSVIPTPLATVGILIMFVALGFASRDRAIRSR